MEITGLITGAGTGAILACIIFWLWHKTRSVSQKLYQDLTSLYSEAVADLKRERDKAELFAAANAVLERKTELKANEVTELQKKTASLEVHFSNSERRVAELTEKLDREQGVNKEKQLEINKQQQEIAQLAAAKDIINENLLQQQGINQRQSSKIEELTVKNTDLTAELSRFMADNRSLSDKIATQKAEIEELQRTAHLQFEKIANKLFEEKSAKFTETNKVNMETLLNPLKEDIHKFREKVETTHTEDTKQRTALEVQIKTLLEQTNKVSTEANNLAAALKGNAQKRGNWGEMILERILESSGLTKGREYFVQQSVKDDEGKSQRPDVRVNLPDDRIIVIDSKVSLIAYDKFTSSEDSEAQKAFLKEHLYATRLHMEQLSAKRYDKVEASLDFTMMFVPIEPAYLLAIQNDPDLWSDAYDKRILLVSPTTLIACLKLFSDLWRREWQNKNAMAIVKRGEQLYEKFVGFAENFEEIGKKLSSTQRTYDDALRQLNTGKGNVISQAVQLKKLGLNSDKKIPDKLRPLHMDEDDLTGTVSDDEK